MNPQQYRSLLQCLAEGSEAEKKRAREGLQRLRVNGYIKTMLLCEAPYLNNKEVMEAVFHKLPDITLTPRDQIRWQRAVNHWKKRDPEWVSRFQ